MAALLLLSICLIYGMQSLTDDKRAEVAARRDTVGRLNILLSTLKDAETGQRGYLLTLNPSYLRPFDSAQERIKRISSNWRSASMQHRKPRPIFHTS